MLGEKLKIQSRVNSDYTDEQLLLIKEMGIKYVYVIFSDGDSNYESVMRFMDRLDKFGLTCTDAGNVGIYKSPAIHIHMEGYIPKKKCGIISSIFWTVCFLYVKILI